jgi:Ca2+-transporting ATPase
MVLLDDNFATMVAAVEEGRVIYENIRKFLRYLLTGNVGEIWLMFLAPLLGMPIPLLPIQILWMNLVTDGLPALALGVEPPEQDVMRRSPIAHGENIFARGMGWEITRWGALVGLVPLAVGGWYWFRGSTAWQTMMFMTLIAVHVQLALAFRSERVSFFKLPFFSNKPLLVAVAISFLLQLVVIYVPFFQDFFHTVSLSGKDLAVSLISSTSVFWVIELEKLTRRAVR